MDCTETLARVREQIRLKGRISYRALKRQFGLDDDYLTEERKVALRDPPFPLGIFGC